MKNRLLLLLVSVGIQAISLPSIASPRLVKYCASTVFRETPFADIRCAKEISSEQASSIKHFEFEYDTQGRLTSVQYKLKNRLVPYSDRFVRAPRTKIQYLHNQEIRTYFDENNLPTLVSGDVYQSLFILNKLGQRKSVKFLNLDGNLVNNDFGIAAYNWTVLENGQVVETRVNADDDLVRNRPGFGYMITRFAYDSNGLLTRMYNWGSKGTALTPDEAGVVMTKISYSPVGQFKQWLNLDIDGKPVKGMSAIAEIIYQPSQFRGEKEAYFFDANGSPQLTRWGAHRVSYEFDAFGNEKAISYFDTHNTLTESTSGIARIVNTWTNDGMTQTTESYFSKSNKAAASSYSGVHKIITDTNDESKPKRRYFTDLQGKLVQHPGLGYAQETFEYDKHGGVSERRFLDVVGKQINHKTWGISKVTTTRQENGTLQSVQNFDAKGELVNASWDPAH